MKKQVRWNYLINSGLTLIGIILIAIVFNILVSVFVDKVPVKLDLTTSKVYEISDSTYEYLETFDVPVTIYIIASEANQDEQLRTVIDKYAQANKNIKIENINPKENPTFGKKYTDAGFSLSTNTVIIDAGERFKVYRQSDLYNVDASTKTATSIRAEQKMTAALKYVASSSDYKVYFVEGHGEEIPPGAETKLQADNYVTSTFNISSEDIPSDADMLIISLPKNDFTKADIAKLDEFFKNAGKAQFLFEGTTADLPNLYTLIKEWGIEVNDDLVIDEKNMTNMGLVIAESEDNDITASISSDRRTAYYPYPKSLTKLYDANSGIEVIPVVTTSDSAYSKDNIEEVMAENSIKKSESDKTGQFIIAAVSTRQGANPDEDAIIFVSGSTLLLDANPDAVDMYGFANYNLYSSVMNYLEGSKENYDIAPRSLISDRLTIELFDTLVIGIICVIIIPLALLICGIVVWIRRKNL